MQADSLVQQTGSERCNLLTQEAQDAVNMTLSFNNIGSRSNWPASYHGVSSANHNLTIENDQLRHMLIVTKSGKFYQVCTAALSGVRRVLYHGHVDYGRGCGFFQAFGI